MVYPAKQRSGCPVRRPPSRDFVRRGRGPARFAHWSRALDDDGYYRLLRDADVLLLPYHVERYQDRTSGVFCEAMTSGKPSIVSDGSFLGLEVHKKGIGWLARDQDPVSLAETIKRAAFVIWTPSPRAALS